MNPLILNATTKTIEAVLAGAITTNQPTFTAGWADNNGTVFTEGASDGALNSTTPVTLVAAPAASTRRIIKDITICNKDTVAVTVTISYNNNGTLRAIATVTLQPGDTWTTAGTYDANGNFKTSASGGTSISFGATTQIPYTNTTGDDFLYAVGFTFDGTNLAVPGDVSVGDDLLLTTGVVINIATGNWVATHTSGILTVGTGELRVTTPGTNSASVVTIGATQTLTNKTLTAPNIGGAMQLAEQASMRLDAAGSADGAFTGITIAGVAGTTLAFGDLIYLAVADSRWELADADAASTAGGVILGICVLAAAADGDPTVILTYGNVRADTAFPTLTVGAPAYVSTTTGDIQVAQPNGTDDVIRVVGFALTADELFFNPSPDYITHT